MNQPDSGVASTRTPVSSPDWMALSWGFLEAITLFIVPDTWITRQALISLRLGLIAALWSLVGAMAGGVLIYSLAARYHTEILAFYDWLPGIGPTLTAKAADELQAHGVIALFLGGYTGTPFKLFAAQANAAGIGFMTFVLAAFLARGSRFLVAALITGWIGAGARRAGISLTSMLWLHAAIWSAFYAWYWTIMAE